MKPTVALTWAGMAFAGMWGVALFFAGVVPADAPPGQHADWRQIGAGITLLSLTLYLGMLASYLKRREP